MELATKKIKHKYEFSKEGSAELEAFHKHILENLKFAFSVFITIRTYEPPQANRGKDAVASRRAWLGR
jgi:Na+/phosphate symporter